MRRDSSSSVTAAGGVVKRKAGAGRATAAGLTGSSSRRFTRDAGAGCRVTVELIASLRKPGVPPVQTLDLPAAATVDDLLAAVDIAIHHRRFVQAVVGEETLCPDDRLRDGMHVKLFTPVGGG